MDADLLRAVSFRLRTHLSVLSFSTTVHVARKKLAEFPPSLVMTGITLPDGTWCDLARAIGELKRDIRLLVAKNRGGDVLLGAIDRRGGYFALPPPHRRVSAEDVI